MPYYCYARSAVNPNVSLAFNQNSCIPGVIFHTYFNQDPITCECVLYSYVPHCLCCMDSKIVSFTAGNWFIVVEISNTIDKYTSCTESGVSANICIYIRIFNEMDLTTGQTSFHAEN